MDAVPAFTSYRAYNSDCPMYHMRILSKKSFVEVHELSNSIVTKNENTNSRLLNIILNDHKWKSPKTDLSKTN